MEFSSLASRKLLVVTGKGGAGKSVLSVALAHRLARAGKRVWLLELGRKRDQTFSRLPELVGVEKLNHTRTLVQLPGVLESIKVSVLDPAQSLAEYVALKLPGGGLAGKLLNNRVTSSFLEVVPGLPDLVQLGKIWHSLTEETGGPDVAVLDAPATGHALSLLQAPDNFRRITRVGPVFRDASGIAAFLADPAQTGIVVAALPEEMAIQETAELKKNLGRHCPPPLVYVNKCFPLLPPWKEADSVLGRAYRYASARAEREHAAVAELKGAHPLPFFFPEPGAPPLYLRLSGALP